MHLKEEACCLSVETLLLLYEANIILVGGYFNV